MANYLQGPEFLINKIKMRARCAFEDFSSNIFTEYKTWYFHFFDYFPYPRHKLIVQTLRNGTRFMLRLNSFDHIILNEIYIFKTYHPLLHKIKNGATVIDIGAHIGFFSLLAAQSAKNVTVYSYEPFKDNFALLKQNVLLNELSKNVKPFQCAVTKEKGTRYLFLDGHNSGNHSFYANSMGKRVKVCTTTLENILDDNNIKTCDLLKIDCQGAEFEILYNTPPEYLKRIENIAMEYHSNEDISRLNKFLEKNGFKTQFGKRGTDTLFAERDT